ncbi:MAG: response regulator [Chitinispirillaceae bacterium]|nr:response regulator [Chitinispirillaceae bacterium]
MTDFANTTLSQFKSKVNLLIVDDDRHILKSLESNFTSPLFKITCVDSFNEALSSAQNHGAHWHCWILDIDLGENRSGLEIMKATPRFPFVIVLSGLQSMRIAAEAVKQGALAVFDKNPDALERLYNETCKTAALGYLLGGKQTQYLPVYRLLAASLITSIEEWAEKACISLRQLHRIAEMHPVDTPKASLSLFYGIYYQLFKGRSLTSRKQPPGVEPSHLDFFSDCLSYCSNHF